MLILRFFQFEHFCQNIEYINYREYHALIILNYELEEFILKCTFIKKYFLFVNSV